MRFFFDQIEGAKAGVLTELWWSELRSTVYFFTSYPLFQILCLSEQNTYLEPILNWIIIFYPYL